MIVDVEPYLDRLSLMDCYMLAAYGYFTIIDNGAVVSVEKEDEYAKR